MVRTLGSKYFSFVLFLTAAYGGALLSLELSPAPTAEQTPPPSDIRPAQDTFRAEVPVFEKPELAVLTSSALAISQADGAIDTTSLYTGQNKMGDMVT